MSQESHPNIQQPTGLGVPVPPTAKPVKKPWWQTRWAIAAAALLLGMGIGNASAKGGTDASKASSAVTQTVTATAQAEGVAAPAATVTVTETVTATETATAGPPAPAAAFGDGMFQVGTDIQPGTYSASGSLCYWARLSAAEGGLESIIANGNGPSIVTIKADDKYFESRNCGDWTVK